VGSVRKYARPAGAALVAALVLALAVGAVGSSDAARPKRKPAVVKTLRGEPGFDASIRVTSHGIPNILARTWTGLGYGYGYEFASQNVCTIAQEYVTVRAERSRFFDPNASWKFEGNGATVNNLNSDFFFQRIKDTRVVEKLLAQKPPNGPRDEIRDGVRGYVAGYNRYLRDTGVDKLPDRSCRGKAWVRPIDEIDEYRYFYMLALLASSGVAIDGIAGAQPPTPALGAAASGENEALLGDLVQRFASLGGLGSNAYGLGREATSDGHGMVLGNPHFPWQGAQRFFESHLTIPGKLDVEGASLYGVPLILIGHTRRLAWSHTVSTARRFTPFEEKLVPGSPTSYVYDGQVRQMHADQVTVKVPVAGGKLEDRTRTLYSTHHGPILVSILGLPLFPWTPTTAHSMGDANAANFRYLNHFFATDQAQSTRELDQVLRRYQGIPWVNTIASDSTGEAYYADIGTIPNVSNDLAARCDTALGSETLQLLGIPILDGSRSDCEWGRDSDAVQPGTFGPSHMPHLFRSDYVTNSNDSYWLSNPAQRLEGFARIIGDEGTARALRTRLGLIMVQQRIAGTDGLPGKRFTLSQLQQVAQNDRIYSGELLRDDLVRFCNSNPVVQGSSGPVDVSAACPVLAAWDLHDNLDSRGAVLWRRFATRALAAAGGVLPPPGVFSQAFDRSDPVNTPRGLNTSNPAVQQAFADAVQDLRGNGIPLNARLREYQSEARGGERIPIHGGTHTEGAFNVITAPFAGRQGFPDVIHGSSFVMAAHLTGRCPEARAILTYSQAATDSDSPYYADQTHLYSEKKWVDLHYCPEQVVRDRALRVIELGCVSTPGFRSIAVSGRRGLFRFRFRTRIRTPASVDVYRANGRPLARFGKRQRRTRLRDGRYFARFRIRSESGKLDDRYLAFVVRHGRIHRLPGFRRADGCGTIRSFALSHPVFGGRGLRISYRLRRAGRVSVTVRRGRRVVKRFRARTRSDGRARSLKLGGGVPRGTYRVRIVARSGGRRATARLSAVRL
jgi:acyl-homoserine-lactone acylase